MFLILLLPLVFCGIFLKLNTRAKDLASGLAGTLLCYEAFVLILANLLGIGGHLTPLTASMAYLLAVLFLFTPLRRKEGEGILLPALKEYGKRICAFAKALPGRLAAFWKSLSLPEKLLAAGAALLCLLLLPAALFTVPYNYDSMTYHLARIGHWIDQGSVNYYRTNIDRQLFSPVLSEYNLLFMMLLSGSDQLLGLNQYAAMLLSAFFIYEIMKKLGAGRTLRLFGVFVFLTMPLTVSQAMTTQNDLGAVLWYLVFLYYLLVFLEKDKTPAPGEMKKQRGSLAGYLRLMVCIGASVGFAFLQKPSVCACMVMFLPWTLILLIRRKDSILSLLMGGGTALFSMLAVMAETLVRTFAATGHLTSPSTSGDIMVATKNVAYIIVNLMKNYCLLITQHYWTWLNGFMYRLAISAGRILHVEVNHVAISFHGFDFITYLNTGLDMYSHDRTSSAFAAYFSLAGGLLLAVVFFRWLSRKLTGAGVGTPAERKIAAKTAVKAPEEGDLCAGFATSAWLGFGFILALLRWQPWGSRLLYPGLCIATVSSAALLGRFFQKTEKGCTRKAAALLMVLSALSLILCIKPFADNTEVARKWIASGLSKEKKEELMFSSHKHAYASYQQLLSQIERTKAEDIGLIISGDGCEYPLWAMLRARNPRARIRHILADDEKMEVYSADEALPDCILWIERGPREKMDHLDYLGTTYSCGFVTDAEDTADCIFYYDEIANGSSKPSMSSGK